MQTHPRHVFAARDYAKFSRASTDATGASLTVLECKVVEVLWRIFLLVGDKMFPPAKVSHWLLLANRMGLASPAAEIFESSTTSL
jgi:hypothetical protein